MDIFQQSINLSQNKNKEKNKEEIKFNDLHEAQDIKEIKKNINKKSKKLKTKKIKKNKKEKSEQSELNLDFDYSKLNIKSLQINCKKIYELQNKPFQPFINYLKKFSENIILLNNNYFNDLFYIKNNTIYLPVENSFIIAFIEINFYKKLNDLNTDYYCLDFFCTTKIFRKNINYILNKNYLKEPLDIRNCFLCPYFDFKNQRCTL